MWNKVIGTFTPPFTKLALYSVFKPINICCGSQSSNKRTNSELEIGLMNIHILLLQDSY